MDQPFLLIIRYPASTSSPKLINSFLLVVPDTQTIISLTRLWAPKRQNTYLIHIKISRWALYSCSVQFSSVVSYSLWPRGLQHARPPCPSPTPRVHPNSCPFSRWCHPTISSSVIPFSSCLQSFPASGSFQMSQPFASGGQSIGVSASTSVLPMNTQDWSPLE